MTDSAAGTRLTLLGSLREVGDGELPELYAYPDAAQRAWLRANFVTSLDGAASVDGTTSSLGGPGDRALFNLLRTLADVIVVGAGTVRAESYGGARLSAADRQHRRGRGQSEVPQIAIVTRSGRLDHDMPVFTRTEVAPLVLTCASAVDSTRHRLAGLAEVVDCSGNEADRVDPSALVAALGVRGLTRLLTEGGPTLLSAFVDDDLLDELCLTIAPCVAGGTGPRITSGPGQVLTSLRCAHVLTDESGYLYTRYVRSRAGVAR
jgi:5-amino-6-(5-phosphoribosylamino)uracil reductase